MNGGEKLNGDDAENEGLIILDHDYRNYTYAFEARASEKHSYFKNLLQGFRCFYFENVKSS
jgi:hypothetical protein